MCLYSFSRLHNGIKGQPTYGSLTAHLFLSLMPSHNTMERFYVGLKLVHLYQQGVVAVLSAHITITCIYLGRFYVRSEVTHKSPPDYCVGKSVLHGKILREVRGHT